MSFSARADTKNVRAIAVRQRVDHGAIECDGVRRAVVVAKLVRTTDGVSAQKEFLRAAGERYDEHRFEVLVATVGRVRSDRDRARLGPRDEKEVDQFRWTAGRERR